MTTMEEVRKNRREGKKWVKHIMFDRPSVLAKNLHNYMDEIEKNIKDIEQLIEKKDKEYVKWEGNNRWQVIVRGELTSLYKARNYLIWLFIRSGVQSAWILADNENDELNIRYNPILEPLHLDWDRMIRETEPTTQYQGLGSVAILAAEEIGTLVASAMAASISARELDRELQNNDAQPTVAPRESSIPELRNRYVEMRSVHQELIDRYEAYRIRGGDLTLSLEGDFFTLGQIQSDAHKEIQRVVDLIKRKKDLILEKLELNRDFKRDPNSSRVEEGFKMNKREMDKVDKEIKDFIDGGLIDQDTADELGRAYWKIVRGIKERASPELLKEFEKEFDKMRREMQRKHAKATEESIRQNPNIYGGIVYRKAPNQTDVMVIVQKLLTQKKGIVSVDQKLFNQVIKANPSMLAEINALFHSILGEAYYGYMLTIPPSSGGVAQRQDRLHRLDDLVDEIIEQSKGKKLDVLRRLNDIVLWHLESRVDEILKKPSALDGIARALNKSKSALTREDVLKYIEDSMIQEPSQDSRPDDAKPNEFLFDDDVLNPLQSMVYNRFMMLGELTPTQAQEFTLGLIQSINDTTDFFKLKELSNEDCVGEDCKDFDGDGEDSPEYAKMKDRAIDLVLDAVDEILREFNEGLKKTIVSPEKIYRLMKEAMAEFKLQQGKSLTEKLKRFLDIFKKIPREKFKDLPVDALEPPVVDESGGASVQPVEIELSPMRQEQEARPDSMSSRGLRVPLQQQDPRLRQELDEIRSRIFGEPISLINKETIKKSLNSLSKQTVAQYGDFTIREKQYKEGDEPPEDPSTPLEIIDNRSGRRYRTTVGRIVALIVFLTGLGVGIWEVYNVIMDGQPEDPPVPPIKPDPPQPVPPPNPIPPEPVPPINPTPSDDPSSWVNKPADEGDILINAIDPAETYLFNQTDEEKRKEAERWREFSLVPPDDMTNPLVFNNYMSQNRRFKNTYPNPKVQPLKYQDISRNRQPQFQDVRFDVFNRKKVGQFERQDGFYTDCGFTREIQQDPFVQDYQRSNYFPDRAILGQPQNAYRGSDSLLWVNNDGSNRFSRADRWYEGSYVGQRDIDKTLYKSKKYDFSVDRFYSRKQN